MTSSKKDRAMVRRVILAALAGALLYFIWEVLAWTVLPLHNWTWRPFADPAQARSFFKSATRNHAFYRMPAPYFFGLSPLYAPADPAAREKARQDVLAETREGPIVLVVCVPNGAEPTAWQPLVCGAVLNLGAAFIAASLVALAAPRLKRYASRVLTVAALGLFVALVAHLPYWNWMGFPLDYCVMMGVDVTIGWSLAGLAIGAIIEDRAPAPPPQPAT